tara:strand:+ start:803 stop:985 length:183 start_codon:yes stop_codon:yes gene_type:complete
MIKKLNYVGYDNNNIPRVFGPTLKDCEKQKQLYLDRKSKLWLYIKFPKKLTNINIRKIEG